jgi:heme exporter protein A
VSTPAIELRQITRRFGHLYALRGVSLSIPQGQTVALLGPNGAGKTTLLRIIATLGKPSSGNVFIQGINAKDAPDQVRSRMGLISHQTLLYDDLTAYENLMFYGQMYGLDHLQERVEKALDTVGLLHRKQDQVRGFSRGMNQRLAIARATLHQPAILLFDEPFTGLDTAARHLLSNMLNALRNEGRTILLVTHDLDQALSLTDRFGILFRGQLVREANTAGMSVDELRALYEQQVAVS